MGIVFNQTVGYGYGYNNSTRCHNKVSYKSPVKVLTPQNIQLLKSLGLKVVSYKRK